MMRFAVLAIALAGAGCLRSTTFHCSSNADCNAGTCEANDYCSFMDSTCTSGRRFGDLAGNFSNTCVGDLPFGDGGVDGTTDAPSGCPGTYVVVSGAPGHRYRLLPQTGNWQTQRDRCATDGTYMVVPDDAGELAAMVTIAGTKFWVGVTDTAVEGTFKTVLGVNATFLPWAPTQPDNKSPGEDCVAASTTNLYSDERCSLSMRTICECQP